MTAERILADNLAEDLTNARNLARALRLNLRTCQNKPTGAAIVAALWSLDEAIADLADAHEQASTVTEPKP